MCFEFPYDPMETVIVYFGSQNKYIKAEGWTVPMPAIYLSWIIEMGDRAANKAMIDLGVFAASMYFGVGELRLLIQGEKYIKMGITSLLLIKGVNDYFLKNETYQNEISSLLGRDVLNKYNEVVGIMDFVLISKQSISGELGEKVTSLISAWRKLDEYNINQLKVNHSELFNLINEKITELENYE